MPIQYIENINKSRSSYSSIILRNDFSAETAAALHKHPLEKLNRFIFCHFKLNSLRNNLNC